jgi:hypothetical protein
VRSTSPDTAVRFRDRDGRRWRAGRLRSVTSVPDEGDAPVRFHVELLEERNGAHRTLDTSTWQVEIAEGTRWVSVERWADGTPSLAGLA